MGITSKVPGGKVALQDVAPDVVDPLLTVAVQRVCPPAMLNVRVPAAMNVWPSTLLTVPVRVWVVPAEIGEAGIDTLVTWVAGGAPAWVPVAAMTVPDPPTLDPEGGV